MFLRASHRRTSPYTCSYSRFAEPVEYEVPEECCEHNDPEKTVENEDGCNLVDSKWRHVELDVRMSIFAVSVERSWWRYMPHYEGKFIY